MDGILRGRLGLAVTVVVVAALAFAGLQLVGADEQTSAQASLPTPPTITVDAASMQTLDGEPDDGLNRFIVALADPSATADGLSSSEAPTDAASDAPDAALELNQRDEDRFAEEDEISTSDRDLLEQLQAGARPDAAAAASTSAPAVDVDDLVALDAIHAVTPAGPGFAGITTSLTADQVATLPGVAGVSPDELRTQAADYYSFQWGHHNEANPGVDIRWEDARTQASGNGVVVAVVDSGVALDHPDLSGIWWSNPGETCGNGLDDDGNGYVDDCSGWDFANNDASVSDASADNNHGTHVSGIIAASDNRDGVVGVAPGARIMPLKIFHNGASSSSRLAAAINYAVDNGADIINLSLGGDNGTPAEEAALRRASDAGIAVIVAAGNEGRNTDQSPSYPAAYDFPTIVAVGASGDDDRRASFSNHGARSVDLFAPGDEVLSTVPGGLAYMSGTSMAAPYAAGAAALAVQRGHRGAAVRSILMQSAMPVQDLEGTSVSGARLDAAAALGIPRGGNGVPEITFHSFNDMRSGVADEAAVVVTAQPADLGVDNVVIRGTLGILYDIELHGIVQQPVTVEYGQTTTDDRARFFLSDPAGLGAEDLRDLREGLELPYGMTGPSGDYAIAIEILDADDLDGGSLTPPALVFFHIREAEADTADQEVIAEPSPGASTGEEGEDIINEIPAPGVVIAPGPQETPTAPEQPGSPVDGVVDTLPGLPGTGTTIGAPLPGTGGEVGTPQIGDATGGTVTVPGTGTVEEVIEEVTDEVADDTADAEGEDDIACLPLSGQDGLATTPALGDDDDSSSRPGSSRPGSNRPGNGRGNGLALGLGNGGTRGDGPGNGRGNGLALGLGNGNGLALGHGNRNDGTDNDDTTNGDTTNDDTTIDAGQDPSCTLPELPADGGSGAGSGNDGIVGEVEDTISDIVDDVTDVADAIIDGIVAPSEGTPSLAAVSITIPEGIPQGAYIRFDNSNAPITARVSDTRVIVAPPAHAPGVVDVAVIFNGQRRYIPRAFIYLEADGTIPAPSETVDAISPIAGGTDTPAVDTPDAGAPGSGDNPPVDTPDVDDEVGTPGIGTPGTGTPGTGTPGIGGAPGVVIDDEDPSTGSGGTVAPTPDRGGPFWYNGLLIDQLGDDSPFAGISRDRVREEACRQEVCAARTR